jgi:glycosyltransferase involved in cell wall biosynthesis
MQEYIQNADIYLATTLETFGIGTLEALASGVPVLGYDWGGTHDIVEHKVSGYLVKPDDIDGLEEGYKYICAHRKKMSENARIRAKQFTWNAAMEKYAKVYKSIVPEKPGVCIVIPSYNYAKYLPDCLDSVLAQTEPADEIIVVNDGSTDNTTDVIEPYLGKIQYIRKNNAGVAAARNDGISKSTQPYIVCLDADDKIAPAFVRTLKSALAHDRTLGIAYSALQMFDDAGHIFNTDWPPDFEWEIQSAVSVPPSNCIPSGCMFRKSMWEKAGGIKQVYAPAEDAEFWVRGLSIGYNAKKATQERLFIYRAHPDSASRTKKYKAIDMWHPWMRDKLYPFGAPGKVNPHVLSYVNPLVNVVIPVGPGHEKYLTGAIDSILGQTFRDWTLTVINDTGHILDMTVYPFAKVIDGKKKGVSHARNLGIEACTTPLILFLDADDFLDPATLEKMVALFEKSDGRYIYTDFMALRADGTATAEECGEYDAKTLLEKALHGVTVLMDTSDAKRVSFLPMEGWEDWEYFIHCATIGIHGKRLSEPLLYYRFDTGMRRKTSLEKKEELKAFVRDRYADYITGEKSMGSCCGGSSAIPILQAKRAIAGEIMVEEIVIDGGGNMVRMEYIGENTGAIWFNVDNRRYRGGNNAVNKFSDVDPADVEYLVGTGRWKVIAQLKAEVKKEVVVPQKTVVETVNEARQIIEEARAEMVIMPEIVPDIEIEKAKEPVKPAVRKAAPRKKK